MAEFLDLLTAISVKLLAFTAYSLIYIGIFAWIFHALAQYQLKVDSWYGMNDIYDGVWFSNDTNPTKMLEF
jgi:hypothetical protein